MSWGVENEKKRRDILELMAISEKIVKENPNHVNEVTKSANGCWMDQMYGMQSAKIGRASCRERV